MESLNKEYKIAKGWKIFILIFLPLFFVLFAWLFYYSATEEPFKMSKGIGMILLSVVMLVFSVIGLIDTFIFKLIFKFDRLIKINILGAKEILFSDIKGVKIKDNYVYVYPKNESQKTLRISTYLENKNEWVGFLLSEFSDLDEDEYVENEDRLYTDVRYGKTQEERNVVIKKTKRLTKILNYTGTAIGLWFLFSPSPYNLLLIANVCLPVMGLFIIYRYNGLIKIIKADNSPYPALTSSLTIPVAAIVIRALLDFEVVSYESLWVPTLILSSIAIFLLLRSGSSEFKITNKVELIFSYLYLLIGVGVFVFCSIILINCAFDESEPIIYEVEVLSKRTSKSRRSPNRYIITINAKSEGFEEMEISTSEYLYNNVESGNMINAYLKKGMLNVRWVFLGETNGNTNSDDYFYVNVTGTVFYTGNDTVSDYQIYVLENGDTIQSINNTTSKFDVPLALGKKYLLGFKKEGYVPKHLIVDVVDCGEYDDYKYGFEFPMELELTEGDSRKTSKEVAYLRYYEETGYIDYHLDSNLINAK